MTSQLDREDGTHRAFEALNRKVRLIVLLNAAEGAGLAPIPILQLHTLIYLANVLSPVWDMEAYDGKVLKRRGGPFYPTLQADLDKLVGTGVVCISNVSHILTEDRQSWRLEGSYHLYRPFADRILQSVKSFGQDERLSGFFQELAYAVSALGDYDPSEVIREDATFGDPLIDIGNVVDFAEWRRINHSADATLYFKNLVPYGAGLTRSEMLHLYVHHLYARLHA